MFKEKNVCFELFRIGERGLSPQITVFWKFSKKLHFKDFYPRELSITHSIYVPCAKWKLDPSRDSRDFFEDLVDFQVSIRNLIQQLFDT